MDPDLRQVLDEALDDGAMAIHDACKAVRALSGLSVDAFARKIGVSSLAVREAETKDGNPRVSTLLKIAREAGLAVLVTKPACYSVRFADMTKVHLEKQDDTAAGFDVRNSNDSTSENVHPGNITFRVAKYHLPDIPEE